MNNDKEVSQNPSEFIGLKEFLIAETAGVCK